MIPLTAYLSVASLLFTIGLIGFLTRRNVIILFLCVELMLQGVALNFVAFARYQGNVTGQVFTLMIFAIAACESAIALAFILLLYRFGKSLNISLWQSLHEPGLPVVPDQQPEEVVVLVDAMPKLPRAGIEPSFETEEG
jgi:NADH-quinone oxidoreductase subunit K